VASALVVAVGVQKVGHDATLVPLADARSVLRTAVAGRRWRTRCRSNAAVRAVVIGIVPMRVRLDAATLHARPLVALRVAHSLALIVKVWPGSGDHANIFSATAVLD
jgi:hypothetical protein